MNTNKLIYLVLPIFLAACSSTDSDVSGKNEMADGNGKLIKFSVPSTQLSSSGTSTTRAKLLEYYDDFAEENIQVTALRTSGSGFFTDERVGYVSADDSWIMDNKYYWPPGYEFNFFARAPYGDTNISSASAQSFVYTVPAANNQQKDFMYAATYNPNSTDGTVQLNFLHGLSAISFRGKTEGTTVSVVVSDIEICNVYRSATFTMPTATTTKEEGVASPQGSWSGLSSLGSLHSGVDPEGVTLSSLETFDITLETGGITMIPQALTAWDRTSKATEQSGCYLIVHCRLVDNGFYLAGSADTYGEIYFPFSENFEAGKHYTYTLTFGVGYDESGKKNEIHLTMTSTIVDWNRETINFDKKIL